MENGTPIARPTVGSVFIGSVVNTIEADSSNTEQTPTKPLVDFTDEQSIPLPSAIKTIAEFDDTFGIFRHPQPRTLFPANTTGLYSSQTISTEELKCRPTDHKSLFELSNPLISISPMQIQRTNNQMPLQSPFKTFAEMDDTFGIFFNTTEISHHSVLPVSASTTETNNFEISNHVIPISPMHRSPNTSISLKQFHIIDCNDQSQDTETKLSEEKVGVPHSNENLESDFLTGTPTAVVEMEEPLNKFLNTTEETPLLILSTEESNCSELEVKNQLIPISPKERSPNTSISLKQLHIIDCSDQGQDTETKLSEEKVGVPHSNDNSESDFLTETPTAVVEMEEPLNKFLNTTEEIPILILSTATEESNCSELEVKNQLIPISPMQLSPNTSISLKQLHIIDCSDQGQDTETKLSEEKVVVPHSNENLESDFLTETPTAVVEMEKPLNKFLNTTEETPILILSTEESNCSELEVKNQQISISPMQHSPNTSISLKQLHIIDCSEQGQDTETKLSEEKVGVLHSNDNSESDFLTETPTAVVEMEEPLNKFLNTTEETPILILSTEESNCSELEVKNQLIPISPMQLSPNTSISLKQLHIIDCSDQGQDTETKLSEEKVGVLHSNDNSESDFFTETPTAIVEMEEPLNKFLNTTEETPILILSTEESNCSELEVKNQLIPISPMQLSPNTSISLKQLHIIDCSDQGQDTETKLSEEKVGVLHSNDNSESDFFTETPTAIVEMEEPLNKFLNTTEETPILILSTATEESNCSELEVKNQLILISPMQRSCSDQGQDTETKLSEEKVGVPHSNENLESDFLTETPTAVVEMEELLNKFVNTAEKTPIFVLSTATKEFNCSELDVKSELVLISPMECSDKSVIHIDSEDEDQNRVTSGHLIQLSDTLAEMCVISDSNGNANVLSKYLPAPPTETGFVGMNDTFGIFSSTTNKYISDVRSPLTAELNSCNLDLKNQLISISPTTRSLSNNSTLSEHLIDSGDQDQSREIEAQLTKLFDSRREEPHSNNLATILPRCADSYDIGGFVKNSPSARSEKTITSDFNENLASISIIVDADAENVEIEGFGETNVSVYREIVAAYDSNDNLASISRNSDVESGEIKGFEKNNASTFSGILDLDNISVFGTTFTDMSIVLADDNDDIMVGLNGLVEIDECKISQPQEEVDLPKIKLENHSEFGVEPSDELECDAEIEIPEFLIYTSRSPVATLDSIRKQVEEIFKYESPVYYVGKIEPQYMVKQYEDITSAAQDQANELKVKSPIVQSPLTPELPELRDIELEPSVSPRKDTNVDVKLSPVVSPVPVLIKPSTVVITPKIFRSRTPVRLSFNSKVEPPSPVSRTNKLQLDATTLLNSPKHVRKLEAPTIKLNAFRKNKLPAPKAVVRPMKATICTEAAKAAAAAASSPGNSCSTHSVATTGFDNRKFIPPIASSSPIAPKDKSNSEVKSSGYGKRSTNLSNSVLSTLRIPPESPKSSLNSRFAPSPICLRQSNIPAPKFMLDKRHSLSQGDLCTKKVISGTGSLRHPISKENRPRLSQVFAMKK